MRGLICDDHPLMRKALTLAMRGRWPAVDLEEAGSYPEAWERAVACDFCVIDLAMPGATPNEGIERLIDVIPAASIVVLTGLTDRTLLAGIERLSVAAVLPKMLDSAGLLDRLSTLVPGLDAATHHALPPRLREVLHLLGKGLTNKEIALQLGIAPATVKIHVSRLIEHLGAGNRTDAVSRAQRSGLI